MRYLIVLPTYNEAENLEKLAERVLRDADAELLVLDDGSPDGTGKLADALAEREPRIQVRHRPGKLGQGSAYVQGFRLALEQGYSTIVQMDCDFSHDPDDIPRLLAALREGADVAIGSRYTPGGEVEGWGLTRIVLSGAANLYARTLLGFDVRDWTSGFKAFDAEGLRMLVEHGDFAEGYGFHVEETYYSRAAGLRVREIPITFVDRTLGKSKMGYQIMFEAAFRVLRLGVRYRLSGDRGQLPVPPGR